MRNYREIFVHSFIRMSCRRSLILFLSLITSLGAHAQLVMSNPLELTSLEVGTAEINKYVDEQTTAELATAVEQNSMSAMFTKMHDWQEKYNSYLKTVDGYASSIKAASHIYNDGVKTLCALYDLYAATESNPQGIVATISITPIILDTVSEAISIFNLLDEAVSVGGSENMLTGAERSKTLWAVNDKLTEFYKKLNRLCLSVRYYNMLDVWYNLTSGRVDRDNGEIAERAHSKWKRAATTVTIK